MTTRSRKAWAGFGWLKQGIAAGYRHPKPLLVGAALLIVACLLSSLITLPMQFHAINTGTPQSPATFGWITASSMLLGLLLVPLYAGYLQLVDTAERGLPARVRDIFKTYRRGEAWRLIGYGLAMFMVYIALFGLVIAATGGGVFNWYVQALTAQANHQLPPTTLPNGLGVTAVLFMVLGLFMMGFYTISLGQVALRHRSVFGALRDGLIGVLKNLLPLLVFALSLILAWIVAVIAIVVVGLLLSLIGTFVGAWLIWILIVPLYIAFMLTAVTAMFGAMYHLWRDVCGGDDTVSGMTQAITA